MKRAVILVNVLLAVAAIYLGAGIYGRLDRDGATVPDEPAGDAITAAPVAPAPDRSRVRYNAVVQRDLFGTARSDRNAVSPSQLDQLKPTVLKLKLWGTVTGDQDPYAVIEDLKTRQQVLYHVGDSVQSATIKMILRDKVVISAGGKDEILLLEEVTGVDASGTAKMPAAFPAMTGTPPAMMGPPQMAPAPAEPPMAQPQETPEPSVNDQMARIGLEPQFAEGEISGLKISRLAPDSVLRRMGLRPGDVITGFNEQAVTNPADAKELFEELDASGEVQVMIRRQGQQQTIDIRQ